MKNSVHVARYENRYAVTTSGKVINLARNEPLKLRQNNNGYLIASLAGGKEGTQKQMAVHRLVALHFLPNPYQHEQVNHKDGDKTNNNVSNLEWCSVKQNHHHAFKVGLRKGYMSATDKETYLQQILTGTQVNDLALHINRRPETLHKMLRETANRLGIRHLWDEQMKENRRNAAIRNLKKING